MGVLGSFPAEKLESWHGKCGYALKPELKPALDSTFNLSYGVTDFVLVYSYLTSLLSMM